MINVNQLKRNVSGSVGGNCQTLTEVTQIWSDEKVDVAVCVYLPLSKTGSAVQVKLGNGKWRSLHPRNPDAPTYWELNLERVSPDKALRFRYRDSKGKWQPFAPMTNLERVQDVHYIPRLNYKWRNDPPICNHAQVVMETPLEGLIAGYEGGVFAPRSREEMFLEPISRQIMRTTIPEELSALGIDAIMTPTNSSVADRSDLNPYYNYLAYDVADFDWQLGPTKETLKLVDAFYGVGVSLVPDLTFVHQVSKPFPGSLDQIEASPFVDTEAFAFRDYGTWMFPLEDPEIRRQLIEKIIGFAERYRFSVIRLGYLDGLIYQYSRRETNYGEVFLKELKAEMKRVVPNLKILGECFAVKDNPVIQECVNFFYAPYGFPVVEELYKDPTKRQRSLYPDFEILMSAIARGAACQSKNAIYAQLHDETSQGGTRENGSNPADLARLQGEDLMAMGELPAEDLLDYTRRLVRNTEAITLFMAKLTYMFVPAVDSLRLGCLNAPGNWKVSWDSVTPEQLAFWAKTGLSDQQIYLLHKQHREDMARLRQIFRSYSPIDAETKIPLTEVTIPHVDGENAVFGLWRSIPERPYETLFIIFNVGPVTFKNDPYLLPIPDGFSGQWEVLFDGDWIDPLLRTRDRQHYIDSNEELIAYDPGILLQTQSVLQQNSSTILPLILGSFNLIVLKFKQQL